MYVQEIEWIVNNKTSMNIIFVLFEGDMTNDSFVDQWSRIDYGVRKLESAGIPYLPCLGNHDYTDRFRVVDREAPNYDACFPVSRFSKRAWYGGTFEKNMQNFYFLITGGGLDWLVFSFECYPRDSVLKWANKIIPKYPTRNVVLTTHAYLYFDDRLQGTPGYHHTDMASEGGCTVTNGDCNNGINIWNECVRMHGNFLMVVNGHVTDDTLHYGVGRRVGTGDSGNKVYQMLANYQSLDHGSGYLRIITGDMETKKISVKTYSPYFDKYLTDPGNQFDFTDVSFIIADTTAPQAPRNLKITDIADRSLKLQGDMPFIAGDGDDLRETELESNGYPIAAVTDTTPPDADSGEGAQYPSRIHAVDDSESISGAAGAGHLNTPIDTIPPAVISVSSGSEATKVTVIFDEKVEQISSELTLNYSINKNINVISASRQRDEKTVILTVSPLFHGQTYQISISGVKDQSDAANIITPSLTKEFQFH